MTKTLDLALTVEAPPPSHETILHGVVGEQEAEIQSIREEMPDLVSKLREIDDRRKNVDFALSKAEQKLNILSGSQTQYRDSQRAEAIAKMLSGDTSVNLNKLPAEDPTDQLTPTDLRDGIAQLRKDRQELGFAWTAATGAIKTLRKRYYKATALLNGARYLLAREELFDAWSKVRAAEGASQELAAMHGVPTYVSLAEWDGLALPGVGSLESMHALRRSGTRSGAGSISGENLRTTGRGESEIAVVKSGFEAMIQQAEGARK